MLCVLSVYSGIVPSYLSLNMAGVHDSFWTHACNVDVMNQILREKFVELYSMPILENVSISNTYCFIICEMGNMAEYFFCSYSYYHCACFATSLSP